MYVEHMCVCLILISYLFIDRVFEAVWNLHHAGPLLQGNLSRKQCSVHNYKIVPSASDLREDLVNLVLTVSALRVGVCVPLRDQDLEVFRGAGKLHLEIVTFKIVTLYQFLSVQIMPKALKTTPKPTKKLKVTFKLCKIASILNKS